MALLDDNKTGTAVTTWLRRVYPLLFAIFPIIGVAAKNPGYYRLVDVVVLSLILIVAVTIVETIAYAVLRIRMRSELAADLAALIALMFVALFYLYEPLPLGAIKRWPVEHRATFLVLAALASGLLFMGKRRGLGRYIPSLSGTSRFFTLMGTLLVCSAIAQLGYYEVNDVIAIRRSALARELALPVRIRPTPGHDAQLTSARANEPKRDIYVIVLDEYASADVYRENYGYDNSPFEDSLRALGFRIPTDLRSNYANTLLSVTSMLNFAQVEQIADVMSPDSKDFSPAAYLMEHNRAERFLKSQGYRFVFFPSEWYAPTRENRDADEEYDPYKHFGVGREMRRSWLAQYFATRTLFNKLMPYLPTEEEVDTDVALRVFAGLPSVTKDPRPTFTFAHLLMPHIGYKVDAECKPLYYHPGIKGLPGELHCLNTQTLKMVHGLLDGSRTAPIIILQGDHGSQSLKLFANESALPTIPQARERFRPFGAYYLPDGGAAAFPDSTSIVNVLRYVFSYYFNADLPPVPNTMYYSHWMYPYRMTEVDANFHAVSPPLRQQARSQ